MKVDDDPLDHVAARRELDLVAVESIGAPLLPSGLVTGGVQSTRSDAAEMSGVSVESSTGSGTATGVVATGAPAQPTNDAADQSSFSGAGSYAESVTALARK